MTQTKQCRECEQDKPLEQFGKSVQSKDGHMYICDNCRAARLQYKRRRSSLALLPTQERDPRYVKILMRHGHSSAALYQRMISGGWEPDQAKILAETAYSDNDRYGRLRRKLGVRFRF